MKPGHYTMTEKVWLYPGESANWHFITLTKKIGQEIKASYGTQARGFGSLPVTVTVGTTSWKTSIFPDRLSGSYFLPLKASVRKKEDIEVGDAVTFSIICYTSGVTNNNNTTMAKGRDMRKEVKKPKKEKPKV
jgi:Domain of unknown function (DUF1905)